MSSDVPEHVVRNCLYQAFQAASQELAQPIAENELQEFVNLVEPTGAFPGTRVKALPQLFHSLGAMEVGSVDKPIRVFTKDPIVYICPTWLNPGHCVAKFTFYNRKRLEGIPLIWVILFRKKRTLFQTLRRSFLQFWAERLPKPVR